MTYEELYYDANKELNAVKKQLAASQKREAELMNKNAWTDLAYLRTTAGKLHTEKEALRIECDRLRAALEKIARLCSGEDQPSDNEQADCTEDTLLEIEQYAKQALAGEKVPVVQE